MWVYQRVPGDTWLTRYGATSEVTAKFQDDTHILVNQFRQSSFAMLKIWKKEEYTQVRGDFHPFFPNFCWWWNVPKFLASLQSSFFYEDVRNPGSKESVYSCLRRPSHSAISSWLRRMGRLNIVDPTRTFLHLHAVHAENTQTVKMNENTGCSDSDLRFQDLGC